VHVLAHGRHFGDRPDYAVGEVVRVRACEAHAANVRHRTNGSKQVGEIVLAIRVRVYCLPEQHHLGHAVGRDALDLADDVD
jgi:hypothetical protein